MREIVCRVNFQDLQPRLGGCPRPAEFQETKTQGMTGAARLSDYPLEHFFHPIAGALLARSSVRYEPAKILRKSSSESRATDAVPRFSSTCAERAIPTSALVMPGVERTN